MGNKGIRSKENQLLDAIKAFVEEHGEEIVVAQRTIGHEILIDKSRRSDNLTFHITVLNYRRFRPYTKRT